MNTMTKTLISTEHHCLQMPYASLRLHRQGLLERLVLSIEQHSQRVPVVVVPTDNNTHPWMLMDGYLRVRALRRLGKDTITAEVWTCDPGQALITLLTEHQSRHWEAFEEALLLQELHTQHGFSQPALAQRIGRDQSWVSRRLALLGQLPESILQHVSTGKLSLWSATRILAPMARAIPAHAEGLLQYLLGHSVSTRELQFFYEHYQGSNQGQRVLMVNDPALFFKAQKLLAVEKKAATLQAGPEGQWRSQLCLIVSVVAQLKNLVPHVLTLHQETHEREALVNALNEAKTQFDVLTHTVRNLVDVNQRPTSNHFKSASKGE